VDANATRYHLLLGKPDWAACLDELGQPLGASWQDEAVNNTSLDWAPEQHQLTLEALLFYYVASPADTPPQFTDRRGAARDANDNWYWIDPSRRTIRTRSLGARQAVDFWPVAEPYVCPPTSPLPLSPGERGNSLPLSGEGPGMRSGPFQPETPAAPPATLELSGLAITEGQYLVVGVIAPAGLLVFDLLGGGPPTQVFWPVGVPFVPFDMSPMPGGGLWILDNENSRYWALDRFFNVIPQDQALVPPGPPTPETFQPEGGAAARLRPLPAFPQGICLDDSTALDVEDPIAIEGLPDCTVLILDRRVDEDFSQVSRFRFGHRLGQAVSFQILADKIADVNGETPDEPFTLIAHDFAFLPEHEGENGPIPDRLYVVSSGGNQTFVFHIEGDETHLDLDPLPEIYLPMRLFSGKALVAAGGNVYYDLGERWLPLVPQSRPRYELEGTFFKAFDSRLPGCTWHRLMLDACIPPDTSVAVWSRAADALADLPAQNWQLERLYQRNDGSEYPFAGNTFQKPFQPGQPPAQTPQGSGTWELLFQRAKGQFVELRVTLHGNGQRTPRLHALRVYYPRFSYLHHYLPAAYRQEPESASFLDRYLANPEGFYTAIEDKIAAVRQLFDVSTAPPEVLEWLASWFGAALDPAWDETRRRLFIRYAMLFFQYRGTPRGLRMALRLALDDCPSEAIFTEPCCENEKPGGLRIIESFRTRTFPGIIYGDPTDATRSGMTLTQAPWQPPDGRADLNERYRQSTGQPGEYPIYNPGDETAAAWQQFSRTNLGFIPAARTADWPLWQAYLMRQYGTLTNYRAAYAIPPAQEQPQSFDDVALPAALPADGNPLEDWYRFETVFLPLSRNAHHFAVLLPVPGQAGPGTAAYENCLGLAHKIVQLEKPAHTTYDIRFFWALFRIGEARLGLDTQLDVGSRNPNFPAAFVLGHQALAEGYLASATRPLPPDRIAGNGCITSRAVSRAPRPGATSSGCGCS
jgi:phage tail-like protein